MKLATFISPAIIDERLWVLSAKFGRDREKLSRVAQLLNELTGTVLPAGHPRMPTGEPDNRILGYALTGEAAFIVTDGKTIRALWKAIGVYVITLSDGLATRSLPLISAIESATTLIN